METFELKVIFCISRLERTKRVRTRPWPHSRGMYESSCSYGGALELKRGALKEEPWAAGDWPPYRLHQSTFEQLKQSVEKAKAALQDRSGLLGSSAFSDLYGNQRIPEHLGQEASPLGFRSRDDGGLTTLDHKAKSLGNSIFIYFSYFGEARFK